MDLLKSQFGKLNAACSFVKYGAPKLADEGSITLFLDAMYRSIFKGASCLGPVNTAIEVFTQCAAKELAPRMRVNCVSPGPTRTDAGTGDIQLSRPRVCLWARASVQGGQTTRKIWGMLLSF